MEGRRSVRVVCFMPLLIVLATSGCATRGLNLVEHGKASLEIISSGDQYIKITKASAYQDAGELIVEGRVRSHQTLPKPYYAHVDVAVATADGRIDEEGTAEVLLLPIPRWGGQEGPFSITFQHVAGNNTKVFVVYHRAKSPSADHRNEASQAAMMLLGGTPKGSP